MENDELTRIVRGKDWPKRGQTVTLSNGKTYFLDTVGKRLRNVDDSFDSIDIEHTLRMKEWRGQPTLDVREDSIVMKCKCGQWLFINPKWRKAFKAVLSFQDNRDG